MNNAAKDPNSVSALVRPLAISCSLLPRNIDIDRWTQWQSAVVEVIRHDYRDLFPLIRIDEIDWSAWKPLYDHGYTARVAVEQALSGSFSRSTTDTGS